MTIKLGKPDFETVRLLFRQYENGLLHVMDMHEMLDLMGIAQHIDWAAVQHYLDDYYAEKPKH